MQTKLETFGSKIGMLAAVVGSSVGLGNVWRFPNEVHENGGAAFLIIYIFCLLVFGIPTMLAEFSLGRAGKSDAIGAYKNTRKGGYWWIGGMFAILACYLIAFFYMLVAGWTLEYLWATLNGSLFENLQSGNEPAFFTGKMNSMVLNSYEPIFWTGIVLVINLVILLKGVNKGIERISNMLMPMLFVILLIFCAASLSMPNASKGVAYFLQPDFTKVSFDTVIDAMGQAFFSLSIGMGILVT